MEIKNKIIELANKNKELKNYSTLQLPDGNKKEKLSNESTIK